MAETLIPPRPNLDPYWIAAWCRTWLPADVAEYLIALDAASVARLEKAK